MQFYNIHICLKNNNNKQNIMLLLSIPTYLLFYYSVMLNMKTKLKVFKIRKRAIYCTGQWRQILWTHGAQAHQIICPLRPPNSHSCSLFIYTIAEIRFSLIDVLKIFLLVRTSMRFTGSPKASAMSI